jgi:ubiquinone/menaquinone biosynthesis C-methylase UbiE
VLDIGCGTGQFAAALSEHARVWAVDAEPEMVAHARGRVRAVRVACAEQLPFKDGWFERAVMRQVVHLVDRPRAFAEARRVLGVDGRLVIATFAEEHFGTVWLAQLFPKMMEIDRARFPPRETLDRELRAAGFHVRVVPISQENPLRRADALERIRGRHISTFDLIDDDAYADGLRRAETLPDPVPSRLEWLVVIAAKN